MTRKEQIEQASKIYAKDCVALKFPSCAGNLKRTDILAAYRAGAEWSDEHPFEEVILTDRRFILDKACEWLKQYRQDTPDGTGYIAGIVNDKTIEDFRKAMKGK